MARRTIPRRTQQRKRTTRVRPASTKKLLLEENSREPYASGDKVWLWSQETSKSKKFLELWEGPYYVMARLSEVRYKLSKVSNPSKVKFLHFDILKHYDEETLRPEETLARKRPTPYRSANFFDAPEMHVKDEAF